MNSKYDINIVLHSKKISYYQKLSIFIEKMCNISHPAFIKILGSYLYDLLQSKKIQFQNIENELELMHLQIDNCSLCFLFFF